MDDRDFIFLILVIVFVILIGIFLFPELLEDHGRIFSSVFIATIILIVARLIKKLKKDETTRGGEKKKILILFLISAIFTGTLENILFYRYQQNRRELIRGIRKKIKKAESYCQEKMKELKILEKKNNKSWMPLNILIKKWWLKRKIKRSYKKIKFYKKLYKQLKE